MTETGVAANLQRTALAVLLESAHTPHEPVAYRGMLTLRALDAPENEMEALLHGVAVHDLGWQRRVAVRGEDRFRWLSGMVTNTVNDLFPNTGAWNLVLNAQGQIQGDLTVWREAEEFSPLRRNTVNLAEKGRAASTAEPHPRPSEGTPFAGESGLELEIAADQYEKLVEHLNRFIVMDDVELVPLGDAPVGEPGSVTAIGLTGPQAPEVLGRLGLPEFTHPMTARWVEYNGVDLRIMRAFGVLTPHYEIWIPTVRLAAIWPTLRTAGAAQVGAESLEKLRIAEGIPAYGVDMIERDLPQETSQMRALHFNKGCYLGQEIVERIRARGSVHRHLRPLELAGPVPQPGTELVEKEGRQDGKPAGQITSAAELKLAAGARVFALGTVRAEAEARNTEFTYAAGTATGKAQILAEPPAV